MIGPVATVEAALRLLKSSTPDVAIVDANLGGVSAKPLVDLLKVGGAPVVIASGYEAGELHALGLDVPLVKKPNSTVDLAKCSAQSRRDRLE